MATKLSAAERELQEVADMVYVRVCNVHLYVSESLANQHEALKRRVGRRWDVACQTWRPLEEPE